MACNVGIDEDGSVLFFCGDALEPWAHCHHCEHFADFLCDAPMGSGQTCDLPLCRQHARCIGPEIDLCPIHAAQHEATRNVPIGPVQLTLLSTPPGHQARAVRRAREEG